MKWTALAALAAAVLALGTTGALSAPAPGNGGSQTLAGTWMSNVTLVNPPPGIDASFQALNTFVAGGGVLVSTGHRYTCTFVWFRFDPTGAFLGLQRVRRTMTVSPDASSFQSTDTVEVLAPDGTVVATLQGSEIAHRLGA